MNLIWVFFLASLCFGHPTFAAASPNPIFAFIARIEGAKEYALYSLITNRCDRYLAERADQKSCHEAVDKKIDLLDFDLLNGPDQKFMTYDENDPHSFIILAFKKTLLSLLSEEKTQAYLNDVQNEISRFLTDEKSFTNLWDLTHRHFPSDLASARAISTLFQDISPVKMHLLFLEKSGIKGNAMFEENKELLGRVIDTIQMAMTYSGDRFFDFCYPKIGATGLNKNFYHFYVPLYLTMALRQEKIAPRFAFTAPLMMTLTYEFVSYSNDYSYLYKDPKVLNPADSAELHKIKDIFTGYSGASFGMMDSKASHLLNDVAKSFGVSSAEGVKLLLGR